MRCPVCNGKLQYQEELSGTNVYDISSDGTYDDTDGEFYGDSWYYVRCSECEQAFDYDIDSSKDYPKVILK